MRQLHQIARRPLIRVLVTIVVAAALGGGCGTESVADSGGASTSAEALTASALTGSFTVSATDITVGATITVSQVATNSGTTPLYPVIVGIKRVGFQVLSAVKPHTGICRIAGSATCNSLDLAPGETQLYTLTLAPSAPGTYQLAGWTDSSYFAGGSYQTVTVVVH